jgi:FkbM family methyltransferase
MRASVKPTGCTRKLFLRTRSPDVATYRKVFIDEEYPLSREISPGTILDCGAHIGLVSIYLANAYPSAKIIAMEPEPRNFKLLVRNVEPYSRITPINAAVWHKNGMIALVDPRNGNWAFRVQEQPGAHDWRALGEVRAMSINRIMAEQGLRTIDLLKMDVEGAEKEVFENSGSWIGKVGVISLEIHDWRRGAREAVMTAVSDFSAGEEQGENSIFFRW